MKYQIETRRSDAWRFKMKSPVVTFLTSDALDRDAACLSPDGAPLAISRDRKEEKMADLMMILITVACFGLSILYVKGCERIK